MTTNILGVYFGHNSNAALVSDGELIAAVEEERFSRKKNNDGMKTGPIESIRYCLQSCNYKVDEIAFGLELPHILQQQAINSYVNTISHGFAERIKCKKIYNHDNLTPYQVFTYPYLWQKSKIDQLIREISSCGLNTDIPLNYVNHHLAHAGSAYFKSPFDNCLIITLDGMGDDLCGFIGIGENGLIKEIDKTNYIHSIGIIYSIITEICGFKPIRHEGKITGLSASGKPCQSLINELDKITYTNNGKWYSSLDKDNKLGPYPHILRQENCKYLINIINSIKTNWEIEDIAASVQKYFENQITSYIDFHMKSLSKSSLVLAGGVFANVKLNQEIYNLKSVNKIHIHPAMTDSGLGFGAAISVAYKREKFPIKPLKNLFLGPEFSDTEIEKILSEFEVDYDKPEDLNKEAARILSTGKVLARFDGRLEYGPRSLGNRSILYQTTDKTVNNWLNKKLKRTEFMPFAPVTMEEYFGECYQINGKDLNSYNFMTMTIDCTEEMKKISPAVVHIDGTARPQIVSKINNPELYEILDNYHKLTNIPSLINTSFNPHEEPIVCNPNEAIKAFIGCQLDFLMIGSYLVKGKTNNTL